MKFPCREFIALLLAGGLLAAARTPTEGTLTAYAGHPRFWIPYFTERGIDPHWARDLESKILWGYIDPSGKFVIPPKFDAAEDFRGNSARVQQGKRTFLINRRGESIKTDLKAGNVVPDSDDLKIKFDKDIFDATGTKLISAKANDVVVYKFSNGLAMFSMPMLTIEKLFPDCYSKALFAMETEQWHIPAGEASQFGYIDEGGRVVIPPRFFKAHAFKAGVALVHMEVAGGGVKEGFIDTSGKLLDGKLHTQVFPFAEGFAIVEDVSDSGLFRSIINTHGDVIAGNLEEACNFRNGAAAVKKHNGWFLINQRGKTIRALPYDDVKAFNSELALVSCGKEKGFIDTSGRLAIPTKFIDARSFSNGLAAAAIKISKQDKLDMLSARQDWKVGFIDTSGSLAISPRFISARFFKEGLAPVRVGLKWGYIDKTGAIKIKPQFDDALSFSEGLACVRDGTGWGFVDKRGNFVIQPRFKSALKLGWSDSPLGSFCEGMALDQGTGGPYRYIDSKGSCCVPCSSWETVSERNNNFHNGLALAYMGHGKKPWNDFGYIDKTGNFVLKGFSGYSGPFSDGLAAASRSSDLRKALKTGYIDTTGKYVIEPLYDKGRAFKEGLAAVAHREIDTATGMAIFKWGFINKNGHAITKEIFDDTREFSEGHAAVKSGEKWGFVDHAGKIVVNPTFDYVEDFSNGLALVKSHDRYGYIDKTGKPVIAIKYWLAASFSDGLALVVFPKDEEATVTIDKNAPTPIMRGLDMKELINGQPERD